MGAGAAINTTAGATAGCVAWRLTWTVTGFSAVTIQIEGSQDGATFTVFPGSQVVESTNPTNWTATTTSNTIVVIAALPFIRVDVTSVTGSGRINALLLGYAGLSPLDSHLTGPDPQITSILTATGQVGHPFTYQITPIPTTYSAANLPAGLPAGVFFSQGQVGRGVPRRGRARQGEAWQREAGPRRGQAGQGDAWPGRARQAGRGEARHQGLVAGSGPLLRFC